MKKVFSLCFITLLQAAASAPAFSQPDPSQFYPGQIATVTKLLQKDPGNDSLIWERARMQSIIASADHVNDTVINDLSRLIAHHAVIRNSVSAPVTSIDYYYTRGMYYERLKQHDKALSDYYAAAKEDHNRRFRNALQHRFAEAYLEKQNYDSALVYADQMIREKQLENGPLRCEDNEGLNEVNLKLHILESAGRKKELVAFYKTVIRDNYALYLKNADKYYKENTICYLQRYMSGLPVNAPAEMNKLMDRTATDKMDDASLKELMDLL